MEVKYKKFDMQDGPDFVDVKSNIKSIRYANGYYEEFHPAKAKTESQPTQTVVAEKSKIEPYGKKYKCDNIYYLKEMQMYRFALQKKEDPQLIKAVKNAKRSKWFKYIGFGAIPCAGDALGSFISYKIYSDPSFITYNPNSAHTALMEAYAATGLAVLCGAAGISFSVIHKKDNKKVVDLYNSLP